jgi:hypothetical protein
MSSTTCRSRRLFASVSCAYSLCLKSLLSHTISSLLISAVLEIEYPEIFNICSAESISTAVKDKEVKRPLTRDVVYYES